MKNKLSNNIPKWIILSLSIFLLFDLAASFLEFYQQALMGDLVPLVLPDDRNAPILSNPFGFRALWSGEFYPNINRFFCNLSLYAYFRTAPFILQLFVNPVESLYLSSSLFKFGVYLLYFVLFLKYICYNSSSWKDKVLAAFVLLPFMQIGGKLNFLSLIDSSIVYLFFYGFPIAVLLLFVYPFYKKNRSEKGNFIPSKWKQILLALLIIWLSFSSAVMPAVLLISGGLYALDWFVRNRKDINYSNPMSNISWDIGLVLIAIPINLYSLYLGTFNPESSVDKPLLEKYELLFQGFNHMFFEDGSYLLIWATIFISYLIARWQKIEIWEGKFNRFLLYAMIFIAAYTLLLPMGGYRHYRPLIIRNDTALPLNVISILLCGTLVFELFKNLIPRLKIGYLVLFAIPVMYGIYFDYKDYPDGKVCEEEILYQIHNASQETDLIVIEEMCFVTSWVAIREKRFYNNHAIMWEYWNIADHKVLLSFPKADW